MELRHLRNFVAVLDCGSFGTAARTLDLSQPGLTKSIRMLEATLRAPLFDRRVKGSTPTALGRALEPHARAILNQVELAETEIAELLGARRGRVRVISMQLFAEILFPLVLQRFHQSHPHVEVALATAHNEAAIAAVQVGAAEIAVCELGEQSLDADLAAEVVLPDQRVIVVAGANHPLAHRRRVTPREAWGHPWVLPGYSGMFRAKQAQLFARYDLPMPAPSSELDSIDVQRRVLRDGAYLGLIPELAARDDFGSGALRTIRVPELSWRFAVGVVYRKTTPLSPAAQRFVEITRLVSQEATKRRRRR